ncbi:MAG TPA: carbon starvation CstA family protein [Phycisphaerales bacterium]|nr:carbon starvation CstA family protein [Phycisphaerales bacterium]
MTLSLLALGVLVFLTLGYLLYGSFIARQYRLDDTTTTPAVARNDGVDFVPARPFYLLGQHFSAIAAAGPIAGPILACGVFGWGPCVLWIVLGVVFIGAVHDFSALVASVRHGAGSIAAIAKEHLGRRAGLAILWFIWLALLYVIIAFTQITASSFAGKAEELEGLSMAFNKGGAVAMASTLYLLLAIVMGVAQRFLKPPMWLLTLVFVPATLGCVWAGTKLDGVLSFGMGTWVAVILAYCLIASMLPMWLLQQPRGYLGGFVLYLAIGIGAFGILFGGYEIQQPMFSEKASNFLNPLPILAGESGAPPVGTLLVPFLFVTIACGACSGFHGLICCGTTSKQVAKESHCKPVAFGAMLLEAVVAIIALATIMILSPEQSQGQPAARVYGDGLASFLTVFLGKEALLFAATFGAMAFSTFVFDTLDVSTRLGRYLLCELFDLSHPFARWAAAGVTVSIPLAFLFLADPKAYLAYWTLFGTSNQLLAALTLIGVTVWLHKQGRRFWYTLAPGLFVLVITVLALVVQIHAGVGAAARGSARTPSGDVDPAVVNAGVACALLALAGLFIAEAWRVAVQKHKPPVGRAA